MQSWASSGLEELLAGLFGKQRPGRALHVILGAGSRRQFRVAGSESGAAGSVRTSTALTAPHLHPPCLCTLLHLQLTVRLAPSLRSQPAPVRAVVTSHAALPFPFHTCDMKVPEARPPPYTSSHSDA